MGRGIRGSQRGGGEGGKRVTERGVGVGKRVTEWCWGGSQRGVCGEGGKGSQKGVVGRGVREGHREGGWGGG